MDFPHASLQATLAATNFAPSQVPSLYAKPDKSHRRAYRKESFIPKPRKSEESKSDIGDRYGQHKASRKSSIKNLGSFFARTRGSISSNSPLANFMSSEPDSGDTSAEPERDNLPVIPPNLTENGNPMSVEKRNQVRERHRKWVKLQDVGNIETTLFTADPGDYSQYDYDDTVDTRRFNEECGDCKDTHVAHDLRPDSESTRHRRNGSLHVNLTPEEVKQYADQVRNMTIADVHLSLFGWWIKESDENFKKAKKHLRELGVDSGYDLSRLKNFCLEELCRAVHDIRPTESRTAIVKQQAAAEQDALRQLMPTRSSSLPIAPRMDTLPPSFREKRERIISEAAQRATSLGSPGGPRDYPPNTPDRPLPLSLRSPSSTVGSTPSLPLGVPSPVSPPQVAPDDQSVLESRTGSSLSPLDETSDWNLRVADIFEQVVSLEDVSQIDRVVEGLQDLKTSYASRET